MRLSEDSLRPIVEPLVSAAGLDFEEVVVRPAGRRTSVAVVVDGDVVEVDTLASLSRAISAALDARDGESGQAYTLEVTSRGVGRPLTLPRHWRRNVGRLVTAHLLDGTLVTGRISASDEVSATIDARVVALAEVSRAVIEVDFSAKDSDD